jgi:hypothetical protein
VPLQGAPLIRRLFERRFASARKYGYTINYYFWEYVLIIDTCLILFAAAARERLDYAAVIRGESASLYGALDKAHE